MMAFYRRVKGGIGCVSLDGRDCAGGGESMMVVNWRILGWLSCERDGLAKRYASLDWGYIYRQAIRRQILTMP